MIMLWIALAATAPVSPPAALIRPDSQAVFVELDPARTQVTASTVLWFMLRDSARTLELRSGGLEVTSLALHGPRGPVTTAWAAGESALRVDALRGLGPGAHWLEVSFLAPWREAGGWRRGARGAVWLDSVGVASALPCAGDSAATLWRLHLQVPRRLRVHTALALVSRERDAEVEVTRWRSARPLAAHALSLRAGPASARRKEPPRR